MTIFEIRIEFISSEDSLSVDKIKMREKVKLVIKCQPQYFFFFSVFNINIVRYESCLKFILSASYYKGSFIEIEDYKVFIKLVS